MATIIFYDTTSTDTQQLMHALQHSGHNPTFVSEPISLENLRPEAETVSVFVSSTVTAEMLERMPKLKLIATRSTGTDHIDMGAAKARGIEVLNVPTYGEHTVAEYAFALLLSLSRKLAAAETAAKTGHVVRDDLCGFDLHGKTFGIIGAGRIGQNAARIAKGFGMRVVAYDPFPSNQAAREIGYSYMSLSELSERSDVISLHAPATDENHHLINASFLAKTKRGTVLVNTGRGELVDTTALLTALKTGQLAGAALDVVDDDRYQEVANHPNSIVTPHMAFNTHEAVERINQTTAANVVRFWQARQPGNARSHMGRLLIVRHGESEWNAMGKWTGTTDVHLTKKGYHQAAQLGEIIKDIPLDMAYASQQIRTLETLEGMLDGAHQFDVPFDRSSALNERDYGEYTGLNKWDVKEKLGEEVFNHLRRDWDYPVPHGETLKMVYERTIPFYLNTVLPLLREGKTVLLASHGNAIRALVKYIESVSDHDIAEVEMPFGNVLVYKLDDEGKLMHKDVRHISTTPTNA